MVGVQALEKYPYEQTSPSGSISNIEWRAVTRAVEVMDCSPRCHHPSRVSRGLACRPPKSAEVSGTPPPPRPIHPTPVLHCLPCQCPNPDPTDALPVPGASEAEQSRADLPSSTRYLPLPHTARALDHQRRICLQQPRPRDLCQPRLPCAALFSSAFIYSPTSLLSCFRDRPNPSYRRAERTGQTTSFRRYSDTTITMDPNQDPNQPPDAPDKSVMEQAGPS